METGSAADGAKPYLPFFYLLPIVLGGLFDAARRAAHPGIVSAAGQLDIAAADQAMESELLILAFLLLFLVLFHEVSYNVSRFCTSDSTRFPEALQYGGDQKYNGSGDGKAGPYGPQGCP